MSAKRRRSKDILLYWTDRVLRSPQSQLSALCLVILSLVLAGAALFQAVGAPGGWGTSLWDAWSSVTGLGKLTPGVLPGVLAVDTGLTLIRWFIFGFLVSMIGTAIRQRLTTVRSGATLVLDRDHTVVLGWNETIYSILDLLHSEDEGSHRKAVVVLSGLSKDEMERRIEKYCRSRRARRTICRTGSIDSVADLERVNLAAADGVLVIGDDSGKEHLIDGHVLRAVLACSEIAKRAGQEAKFDLLVGHRLPQTGQLVANLSDQWEGFRVKTVHTLSVLAKIVAQCAWQPGLAAVYRELLTYSHLGMETASPSPDHSDEIYCVPAGEAGVPAGSSFEQLIWGMKQALPIGYLKGTDLYLNPTGPAAAEPLVADDIIVALAPARRDVSFETGGTPPGFSDLLAGAQSAPRSVLLAGRGQKARTILADLVHYLPEGSTIAGVEDIDTLAEAAASREAARGAVSVTRVPCDDLSLVPVETLRELVTGFDIIVIASDERDREEHDTSMLAQISAVRAACGKGLRQPVIVAELLDQRDWQLAANMGVRDILVTPELASNYLVQLIKNPLRAQVYAQLLAPEGAEIHIRPSASYLPPDAAEVSFSQLMAVARARRETLIGYFEPYVASARGARLALNPSDRDRAYPAGHFDRVVVVAPE